METKGLITSAGIISFFTLLSRITGVIRDSFLASILGTSMSADAFFVAFRIPNLFRRFFGEGAVTVAIIPVFTETINYKGMERAKLYFRALLTATLYFLGTFTILCIIASSFIVMLFAPGFLNHYDKFSLTVALTQITFPYILFITIVALFMGVLNSLGHFSMPAFSPIILNITMVLSCYLFAKKFDDPSYAVAWGVFIAGIMQIIAHIPFLKKNGISLKPTKKIFLPEIKETTSLLAPSIFSAAIYQINLLISTILASFLESGSISYLYYSGRFFEFPLGILIFPITSVILPYLSNKISKGDSNAFFSVQDRTIRFTLFITLPATIGLILISREAIEVFFHWGKFNSQDVIHTTRALCIYSIGLIGVGYSRVLTQFYYSEKDFKKPARFAIYTFISNIVLSIALMKPLSFNGLALATTISSYINTFFLVNGLKMKGKEIRTFAQEDIKTLLSTFIMGICIYATSSLIYEFLTPSRTSYIIILIIKVFTGVAAFYILGKILKINEINYIEEKLLKK